MLIQYLPILFPIIGPVALFNQFTENQLLSFMGSVQCNGTEANIFECQFNQNNLQCGSTQDAAVYCIGNVETKMYQIGLC